MADWKLEVHMYSVGSNGQKIWMCHHFKFFMSMMHKTISSVKYYFRYLYYIFIYILRMVINVCALRWPWSMKVPGLIPRSTRMLVEFACPYWACVGFFLVLWFLYTVQTHVIYVYWLFYITLRCERWFKNLWASLGLW